MIFTKEQQRWRFFFPLFIRHPLSFVPDRESLPCARGSCCRTAARPRERPNFMRILLQADARSFRHICSVWCQRLIETTRLKRNLHTYIALYLLLERRLWTPFSPSNARWSTKPQGKMRTELANRSIKRTTDCRGAAVRHSRKLC